MEERWAAELKCGRETLEAVWEGQSPLLLKRPLPRFLQNRCRKESTNLALHCLKASAHSVPKLLGSDQKWIQYNFSGENDS